MPTNFEYVGGYRTAPAYFADVLDERMQGLITGLPKRQNPAETPATPKTIMHSANDKDTTARGKICYISAGRPDPDPDPAEWSFKKITAKGSRMFVRRVQ